MNAHTIGFLHWLVGDRHRRTSPADGGGISLEKQHSQALIEAGLKADDPAVWAAQRWAGDPLVGAGIWPAVHGPQLPALPGPAT